VKDIREYFSILKKLVLYGVNGGINTIVTYVLFIIISNFINYQITIVIVYGIGIVLSYVLNKRFVFNAKGKFHIFVMVHVGLLISNVGITTVFVEYLGIIKEIAMLITIIIIFLFGFTVINRFVFPQK
jgi:putative flippase GtrA